MKNRIYVFTGTGNSLQVARTIAVELNDCELVAICKGTLFELPTDYERIGFVFPTYAGGLPKMVATFIHNMKLPLQNNTYLFAIATYGANVGSVISQVGELFKLKDWHLNYGAKIWSYPNLVTAYPMIKGVGFFTKRGIRKSKQLSKKIITKHQTPMQMIKKSSQKMYDGYIAQISDSDKDFHVNEDCISCGVCSNICPAKNITMVDGKPTFHHQCESCMACIQYCPKRAINYKDKTQRRGRYTHPNVTSQEIIKLQEESF